MLFLVKARIDLEKLYERGQKLQNNELDLSNVLSIYCLEEDPSVGISIWQADSREKFDQMLAPHKEYYAEVIEVTPVITTAESKEKLMNQIAQ